MAQFKYSAISKGGEKVSGVVEAYGELDAVSRIRQSCDVVLKVQAIDEDRPGLLNMEIGGQRLDTKAFSVMCSQFAIILRSGVPVSRAVWLIAEKTANKPLKRLLTQVAEDVEAGRTLAASFAERGGKLLPVTFVETIRSGEESGSIDRSFETMAEHYDKQLKRRSKVRSALIYPIFVIVLAVVVVAVLMIRVVPVLTTTFEAYGSELPGITRALIAISYFFRNYFLVVIVVLAALVLAVKLYGNTEGGRLRLAKLGLRLPIFGNINTLNAATQFANSMTALLGAGLPIPRAVSITSKVIDNYYVSQEVGKLSARLEEGRTLGESVRESGCLPDILTDMISVGEETGELEKTLGTISGYYDNELEAAVESALKRLEPAILVVLAGIAGFIVIAIYLAMFQMYSIM